MSNLKYSIDYTKSLVYDNHTLYRIIYQTDITELLKDTDLYYINPDVLIGGWIESYDNLDQEGNCAIFNDAKVYGNAQILDDAIITDEAVVTGEAVVSGNVRMFNDSVASGQVLITDNAKITGSSYILCEAYVGDNADITGSLITNHACVFENAKLKNCKVEEYSKIYGSAELTDCHTHDYCEVYGPATKLKNVNLFDFVRVRGNADLANCKIHDSASIGFGPKMPIIRDQNFISDVEKLKEVTKTLASINLNNQSITGYAQTYRNIFYASNKEWQENKDSDKFSTKLTLEKVNLLRNNVKNTSTKLNKDIEIIEKADTFYEIHDINLGEPVAFIRFNTNSTWILKDNDLPFPEMLFDFYIDFDIDGVARYHRLLSGYCLNDPKRCILECLRVLNLYFPQLKYNDVINEVYNDPTW